MQAQATKCEEKAGCWSMSSDAIDPFRFVVILWWFVSVSPQPRGWLMKERAFGEQRDRPRQLALAMRHCPLRQWCENDS